MSLRLSPKKLSSFAKVLPEEMYYPNVISKSDIYFSKGINIWEWKVRTFLVTHFSLMIEDDCKGKLLQTYQPFLKMTLLANFLCAVLPLVLEVKFFSSFIVQITT